jgi:hypothetical protein
MKKCEKCGKAPPPDSYQLFDYCAVCSKDLCPDCMAKGHCGHTPALSGMGEDYSETPEDSRP